MTASSTGHRIDHQQDLLGLYRFLDAPQLVHELFVDVEASGGIQDQNIIAVVPGMQDRLAGDLHRVSLPHLKHRHAGLLADDLQLLDRSRTIDVTGCQQRTLAALLEIPGQLGTVGGLTGTLKAAHHNDGGDLRREGDPGVGGTHQFGQFVIDDLDDLLGGSQALEHFTAHGLFTHRCHKVLGDLVVDIRFQKCHTDFPHDLLDVTLLDLATAL